MKKMITSVGLVALGATGLQAAYAPGLTRMETTKPWTVAASLRGFYDDNYSAVPDSISRSSVGYEIRPSAGLNLFPTEQSHIGLQYIYSHKYYEDRTENKADNSHEFEAKASHAFSERYQIDFDDSFVASQEPSLVDPGAQTTFIRTDSNALRNRASLNFKAQVNERMGIGVGYDNTFYDYKQDGDGSRSALLDRVENLFHLDARWLARPGTVGLVGYQWGNVNHTSKDLLYAPPTVSTLTGSSRDNNSHYLYLGGEHEFNPRFNLSAKAGVQFTKYDDAIGGGSQGDPYGDINCTYTYLPGSSLQAGIRHSRNATDITGSPTDPTLDQESTVLYASVSHRLRPDVMVNLLGSFQHGVFNGGGSGIDNESENYFTLGLNVDYRFNQYWSAEAGYNFDKLNSNSSGAANRDFSRNRMYLGVRATY